MLLLYYYYVEMKKGKMDTLNNCDKTYIQVSKKVRLTLCERKEFARETYEDVLRRILNLPRRFVKPYSKQELKNGIGTGE